MSYFIKKIESNRRFQRHHFECGESIVTFLCNERYVQCGINAVVQNRNELHKYIEKSPEFKTAHQPLQAEPNAPHIVRKMCEETTKLHVGPMAAVAGAIADIALCTLLAAGAPEAVVDNGGDIALFVSDMLIVGVYAENPRFESLVFRIEPRDSVLGICTSSGTVGHSWSYGRSYAAVVISEDVVLADAAATALGNYVQEEIDIGKSFSVVEPIEDIEGALVILKDKIGLWGTLPQLTKNDVDYNLITMGKNYG